MLSLLLLLAGFFGIAIGTVNIPIKDLLLLTIYKISGSSTIENIDAMFVNIVWNIRLPRVLLAGFVGAALAIAGAAFQGLLRNPLADPFTLGVSSGASVGAVITIFFNLSIPWFGAFTLPFLSIVAAFLTVFIIFLFAVAFDSALRVETIILP